MSPDNHSQPKLIANSNRVAVRKIGAVVLAGGYSRRMGRPKASLELRGRTFLDQIVRALSQVCQPLVIVGAGDMPRPPQDWNCPAEATWLADRRQDEGPLQGMAVGLSYLNTHVDRSLIVGCDTPLVKTNLVGQLADQFSRVPESTEGLMISDENNRFALLSIWRTRIANRLNQALMGGTRRFQELAQLFPIERISLADCQPFDPELQSFWNINTPNEYQQLLQRIDKISDLT